MSGAPIIARWRTRSAAFLPALRDLGLAPVAEWALRKAAVAMAARENRELAEANPDLTLPPAELVFETQGHAQVSTWLATGRVAAAALVERLGPLVPEPESAPDSEPDSEQDSEPDSEILDWGAGAGRVLRWLPEFAPQWQAMGAEPNSAAIRWISRKMPALSVVRTGLRPPLPFAGERFAAIYTISVFTHIPVAWQRVWIRELRRILRPGGILALSLHGTRARAALGGREQAELAAAGIIERKGAANGSRLFATYHSEHFIREVLLEEFNILLHEPDSPVANGGQDLWICRRV